MRGNASPRIFRVLIPAKDLETSRRFYGALLGVRGRRVAPGRVYFDAGGVIVGVLDFSGADASEFSPPTEALYFATHELDAVFRRAEALGCLSSEIIHNDPDSPAGEIVVRPWGERSFYAKDPSGNPLCFVDETTLFTGTAGQVAALARPKARRAPPRRGRSRGQGTVRRAA